MKLIVLTFAAIFGVIASIGVFNAVIRPLYNKHLIMRSIKRCEKTPNSRCSGVIEVVLVSYGSHVGTATRIADFITSATFAHRLRFLVVSFKPALDDANKDDLTDYVEKTPILRGLNPKGSKAKIAVRVMNVEGVVRKPMGAFALASNHFDPEANYMFFASPFVKPVSGWDERGARDLVATKNADGSILTYGIEQSKDGSAGRTMTKPTFATMTWVGSDLVVRWMRASNTASTPSQTKVMCEDLMFMTRPAAVAIFEALSSQAALPLVSWGPSYTGVLTSAVVRNLPSPITPMMPTELLAVGMPSANWAMFKEAMRSDATTRANNVQSTTAAKQVMDKMAGTPFEKNILGVDIKARNPNKHGLMGTIPSLGGADVGLKYGTPEALDATWTKLHTKLYGTVTDVRS